MITCNQPKKFKINIVHKSQNCDVVSHVQHSHRNAASHHIIESELLREH